ncbi:MAG: hypothetical protein AAFQ50_08860, partial [Pseudomonadota bacterium]
ALDMAVYDLALMIVLGVEKVNWERPPAWAVMGSGNAFALAPEAVSPEVDPPKDARPLRKRRPARRTARRFDGW